MSEGSPLGKAGLALLGAAGVAGIIYAFADNRRAMLILVGGMVLVGLLLLAYKAVLSWSRKRKSAPMMRGVLNNAAVAPNAVSDPNSRAALDDLRKKFEEGISKFRAAGKDLYSLPWYVFVGEPGSGKTEAIRRSQVGFPPGLQDPNQGAGGTLNMNWWFTNQAIILDTAGKLMFKEVPPGTTSEWREFLGLLTHARPNCPINGMILVIPADTLILDTADAIERKAGKIAQQLDQIQRDIGVRFPVFVLVTKCDLINGFREFFDALDDPQLRDQILGWSNPAPLDLAFNPELVDQHMDTVRQRLASRRYALLMDPVHTEDPNERRVDQVDALYTFPESFMKIVPRLRRYLEMIFVAGEWSPKPLFLRGIYFTSSMREGSALDQELAEILRVPVDSQQLQERKVWERDRAFFLRDVFLKKVFPEKGLVTRAVSPQRLQRRRKLAVMAAAFIAVLSLFALTYFGMTRFRQSLGGQNQFWTAAAEQAQVHTWKIVEPGPAGTYKYRGLERTDVPGVKTVGEFFVAAQGRAEQPVAVPAVFLPVNLVESGLSKGFSPQKRAEAYRLMFETRVLGPLMEACRGKLLSNTPWTPESTKGLLELIELEKNTQENARAGARTMDMDTLFEFVLGDARDYKGQQKELRGRYGKSFQDAMKLIYGAGSSRGKWPPENMGVGSDGSRLAINAGVAKFDSFWRSWLDEPKNSAVAGVDELRRSIEAFEAERDRLRPVDATEEQEYVALKNAWNLALQNLTTAKARVDAAVGEVEQPSRGWAEGDSIAKFYEGQVNASNADVRKAYDELRAAAQTLTWLHVPENTPQKTIAPDVAQQLKDIDAYVGKTKFNGQPRYAVYHQIYQMAGQQLAEAEQVKTVPFGQVVDRLEAVGAERAEPELVSAVAADGDARSKEVVAAWRAAAESAARYRRWKLLEEAIPKDKYSPERWDQEMAQAAEELQASVPHPGTIPLSGIQKDKAFRQEYNPAAAQKVLGTWAAIGAILEPAPVTAAGGGGSAGAKPPPAAGPKVLEQKALDSRYAAVRDSARQYVRRYLAYWSDDVPNKLAQPEFHDWDDFRNSVQVNSQAWDARTINGNFGGLCDRIRQAVARVNTQEFAPFSPDAAAVKAASAVVDAASQRLDDKIFARSCQTVLASWKDTPDAMQARSNIIDLTPTQFIESYVPPTTADDSFVSRYWATLTGQLVKQLAQKCDQVAGNTFDAKIRPFARFPLAPHHFSDPGEKPLTTQELDNLRVDVASFLPAGGGGGAALGKRIVDGAPLQGYENKDSIEKLRRLNVPAQDPNWLAKAGKILDALSQQAPSKVTIYLLNRKERDQYLRQRGIKPDQGPEWSWSDIYIEQGGQRQETLRVEPGEKDKPIGQYVCRGDPIVLKLTNAVAAANAPAPNPCEFHAPWPGIELLWAREVGQRRVQQAAGGRQTWDVEINLPDANNIKRQVWLRLEFEKELPPEWPDLRK